MTADHGPYIAAVADALDAAGLYVIVHTADTTDQRRGEILLGVQDNWDFYEPETAVVAWSEHGGWTCRQSLTETLAVPTLAAPWSVGYAACIQLGPASRPPITAHRDSEAAAGRPEFEEWLMQYAGEGVKR